MSGVNKGLMILLVGLMACTEAVDDGEVSSGSAAETTEAESIESPDESNQAERLENVMEGDGLTFGDNPEAECEPQCGDNTCDVDDGCGGVCECADEAQICNEGVCCVPSCEGKVCGLDGCGGSCDAECVWRSIEKVPLILVFFWNTPREPECQAVLRQ